MSSKRILLSSVMAPLGPEHGDGAAVGYELLHAQVTRAQGIFSPRAVHVQYGIEYIAANLDTPAITLHYPDEETFTQELQQGRYSHVGIAFNLSTAHQMRHMCRLVREHAPEATIVLGGYGTVLPDEELLRHGDVICRGEGVAFTRALLGEPERKPPYDHPLVVSKLRVLSLPVSRTGLIFGGLGCPNGCDFCCTSHFFDRRHVRLLPTGRDLFRVARAYKDLGEDIEFTVLDEDFLLNKRRAFELRELLQEAGMHLDMFVFASVKALSMYTPQELVEIGVGGVWMGYEGTRSGYAKQKGRPLGELIADLKDHGILVLASMIVGLDYQTPEIVREEFEGLMDLEPTLSQFLIYGPTPGTPLGARTDAEDRWLPQYKADPELRWRRSDGFSSMTKHPLMSPETIEGLQRWCFEEDFRRLGPSIMRTAEVWQTGREQLTGSEIPSLRRRADYLARRLDAVGALLPVGKGLAPTPAVRARMVDLEARLARTTSRSTRLANRLKSLATWPAAAVTKVNLGRDLARHPTSVRNDWSGPETPPVVRFGAQRLVPAAARTRPLETAEDG